MIYNLIDDTFINNGALDGKTVIKLRQYDNRLWAVCDDGSIVFSDNGDATTWNALNIILLPNQEAALDFIPVQGGVIIPHRSGAYTLYGSGTYQDTSILPIQASSNDPVLFTDSAVAVDNVVYILGNRGIYAVSLNGIQELPHDQNAFFSGNYSVWNAPNQAIQGIYLYKYHAILYLFHLSYGAQGFLYSIRTGAFQKVNQDLPSSIPYMLEMNDSQTDFILGTSDTEISRSVYPSGTLTTARTSIIQTRHEDAGSKRNKVWRSLGIQVSEPVNNVMIRVYLNYSSMAIDLKWGVVDLVAGDNVIDLLDSNDANLRGKAISIELQIGNQSYLVDETTGMALTADEATSVTTTVETITRDESNAIISDTTADVVFTAGATGYLTSDDLASTASSFAIQELRLKYREVGPIV